MARYEVVEAGYVPVGPGFKYKKPGQVVTLKAAEARKLGEMVRKVEDEGVAKRNTPAKPSGSKPKGKADDADGADNDNSDNDNSDNDDSGADSESAVLETETMRVVSPDGSESTPADERAGDEAGQ